MPLQNIPGLQSFVEKARNGDKEAFREIFDALNSRIFSYVVSRTSNRDESLDLTQEIFIDLWHGLRKFKYKSDEAFYGFVFAITKRKIYKHYKSRRPEVSLDENEESASYEMEIKDYRYLHKKIEMLSPKYRDLLKLRYWSEMTFEEIASFMNIRLTTAKVRHHRAIKKLKVLLEKNEYDF